jgi:class 3 adenylate cyclase
VAPRYLERCRRVLAGRIATLAKPHTRGDDVLIVDHSAYHVIRALRSIVASLRGSHFPQCELRFGLDWGQVISVPDAAGNPIPSTGLPLRRAARLEAMARPGSALMTEIASRALTESGVLPHFVWRSGSILARSNSAPARPYIARFRVLRRLIWPSA